MARILLVADVSWVMNDVRAALSNGESTLDVVSDPRLAAESVVENAPDAVLIDLQVGSMGGMAVTRAIRDAASTGGGRRPAVILLLDRGADRFLAGRSGADGSVVKPFTSAELQEALEAVLGAADQS